MVFGHEEGRDICQKLQKLEKDPNCFNKWSIAFLSDRIIDEQFIFSGAFSFSNSQGNMRYWIDIDSRIYNFFRKDKKLTYKKC
jgi:hypothetical protein